jgi:hypothetical protein
MPSGIAGKVSAGRSTPMMPSSAATMTLPICDSSLGSEGEPGPGPGPAAPK